MLSLSFNTPQDFTFLNPFKSFPSAVCLLQNGLRSDPLISPFSYSSWRLAAHRTLTPLLCSPVGAGFSLSRVLRDGTAHLLHLGSFQAFVCTCSLKHTPSSSSQFQTVLLGFPVPLTEDWPPLPPFSSRTVMSLPFPTFFLFSFLVASTWKCKNPANTLVSQFLTLLLNSVCTFILATHPLGHNIVLIITNNGTGPQILISSISHLVTTSWPSCSFFSKQLNSNKSRG